MLRQAPKTLEIATKSGRFCISRLVDLASEHGAVEESASFGHWKAKIDLTGLVLGSESPAEEPCWPHFGPVEDPTSSHIKPIKHY